MNKPVLGTPDFKIPPREHTPGQDLEKKVNLIFFEIKSQRSWQENKKSFHYHDKTFPRSWQDAQPELYLSVNDAKSPVL